MKQNFPHKKKKNFLSNVNYEIEKDFSTESEKREKNFQMNP